MERVVRIGCGAGFWGDSPEGPAQLVASGGIDYLVMDYLAEITMSILARAKTKDPTQGYAPDFVTQVMRPLARQIADRRIRVVTNAGGLNPLACRDALVALFAELGVSLKVAVVTGDDLSDRVDDLRAAGAREMFSGAPLPDRLVSINAYLGAFPVAAALTRGADVVVTGRCVDSALVLGPLIHEFGWGAEDFDLLSAGSLAGHIIECGTQCTGGVFTPATIAEQVVYEVGDPGAYVLPDVTCDWRSLRLEQAGPDVVRVTGARGRAPTRQAKVSATHADGWRSSVTLMIAGAFAHFEPTGVERIDWPGLNLEVHDALGGGGIASLRHDPQGKVMARGLLDTDIEVPADWLVPCGPMADLKERNAA